MDTNLQARVQDILQKNDRVAIAFGKTPTLDDIAASLSLYLGLTQLGKKVAIASPVQPLVEHASLVGVDKIKMQLDGEGGDLVVSFPYREGEIEKVSYTIDNGFLNIVVKAGQEGLAFEQQDVRYTRGGGAPQILFIVGTPRLSDLGSLFNPEVLKETTIINIDNKQDNQGFGDIVLASHTASSVSEIVGELLVSLGADLDIDVAQNLLNGISFGTGNFQSPKTTYLAFEMAASFMKKGARREAAAPQVQNEERVSSFMPEQMLSQSVSTNTPRNPVRNPYLGQQAQPVSNGLPQYQQRSPMPQPMPRPQMPQMPRQPIGQQPMTQPRPLQQQVRPQLTQQQIQQQLQAMQQQSQAGQQADVLAPQGQQKPPSDWLTPKVYKGSSSVS